jgi:hypothetical protein
MSAMYIQEPVWRSGVRIPAWSRYLVQTGSGAHPDSTELVLAYSPGGKAAET